MRKLAIVALITAFASPALAELQPNERNGLPKIYTDIQQGAQVTKAATTEKPVVNTATKWSLESRDRNR